jgi:hypothetical protein
MSQIIARTAAIKVFTEHDALEAGRRRGGYTTAAYACWWMS